MVNKNVESEEDLPCQDPLVIFTGAADKDYFVGNERSGNFVLRRKLYSPLTKSKSVDSEVFVTYVDENNRYKQIKNNLIKSIISVIGKLKISRTNKMHLVAKEIEWNLVTGDTKSCIQGGENKNDQEEKELELIEKNFEKINKKRKRNISSTSTISAPAFTTIASSTSTPSSSPPPPPHSLPSTNATSMSAKGKERAYLELSKDIIHDEQESNK